MKERIKKLIGLPLILIILAIILFLGIRSGELGAAYGVLSTISPSCVLGCCLCFGAYILVDALGIHSALRSLGYRLPFHRTLMVAIRGQYYYYITPGASGGQPVQIYYLHELGIPTGVGTSVLVCHFAAFQTMLAVLMTVFGIPYYRYIRSVIDPHFILLIIGYLVNAGIVLFLLLFSFSRRVVRLIIRIVTGLMRRFRLLGDPAQFEQRITATADVFHDSMDTMRSHPGEILRQLFLGGIQQLLLMSVLCVIYNGFGLSEASPLQIIVMSLAQYISAAYVPIPGASGAQEGVFALFFRQIFLGSQCFAAMIIWRVTTFYLPLLISALSIILYSFYRQRHPLAKH